MLSRTYTPLALLFVGLCVLTLAPVATYAEEAQPVNPGTEQIVLPEDQKARDEKAAAEKAAKKAA